MAKKMRNNKLMTFFDCDDGSWNTYAKEDEFLTFITPLDGNDLTSSNTDVFVKALPFYKNVNLIQLTLTQWEEEPDYYFFLEHDGDYIMLKGESDVIYEVNETGALNITKENAADYLKFFCLFTKTDEGESFYIIESEESEFLKGKSPYEKSRYLRKFSGTDVSDIDKLGRCTIKARTLCENYVYDTVYEVTIEGQVEMKEDVSIGSI